MKSSLRLPPLFSQRALIVFLTLIGLYLVSWELTKRSAIGRIVSETRRTDFRHQPLPFDSSPAPFVVSRERYYGLPPKYGDYREYHFWLCGHTVRLPFERSIP